MQRPGWAPDSIDMQRPSAARIYDYLLGGSHNFAVDRAVADQAVAVMPDTPVQAQANRAFLGRAVRYLTAAGVRQFLDIGSGIPTQRGRQPRFAGLSRGRCPCMWTSTRSRWRTAWQSWPATSAPR